MAADVGAHGENSFSDEANWNMTFELSLHCSDLCCPDLPLNQTHNTPITIDWALNKSLSVLDAPALTA